MTWILVTKDSEKAVASYKTADKILFAFPSNFLFPMGIMHKNLFLGNRLLLTVLSMIDRENTNIHVEGFSLPESQFSTEVCEVP